MTPPKLVPLPTRMDELFPEWGEEVDRRIAASEIRIKFWIMCGILGNLVVVLIPAIMMIFYFGQVSTNIAVTSQQMKLLTEAMKEQQAAQQETAIWRARVDALSKDPRGE